MHCTPIPPRSPCNTLYPHFPPPQSRDCTLREAIVFGTVLAKKSIPSIASSAAMVKISQMDYSGANSIFLRYA